MLVIQDKGTPPVEGWQFPIKETGFTVSVANGDFLKLLDDIHDHCATNNVPEPSKQEVIDYVCKHLHTRCYDDATRQPLANKLTSGVPYQPKGCCGQRKR